jgi:hypothetical protein
MFVYIIYLYRQDSRLVNLVQMPFYPFKSQATHLPVLSYTERYTV